MGGDHRQVCHLHDDDDGDDSDDNYYYYYDVDVVDDGDDVEGGHVGSDNFQICVFVISSNGPITNCLIHTHCNFHHHHHHLPGEHVKVELFWSSNADVSPVDLPRFFFTLLWGCLPISDDVDNDHGHDDHFDCDDDNDDHFDCDDDATFPP